MARIVVQIDIVMFDFLICILVLVSYMELMTERILSHCLLLEPG